MNSLGLDKSPSQTRVVVAMSGGVDSSVTAALYKQEGYDVVGVTLQLFAEQTAFKDAQRVAQTLGIEHHVLDCVEEFQKSIIDDFAKTYADGETPIPCALCNKKIKFGALMDKAKALGGDVLATGHYVQRKIGSFGTELHKATDERRDQSYFLFLLSQEQLDFARFPLGMMSGKDETRALAKKFNLPVAEKPDSQDICFVTNNDYAALVKSLKPDSIQPGEIVDEAGHFLARHEGIIHFTVGQRRGLDISARRGDNNDPLYVLRLDAARNRVIVGPREALAQTEVRLRNVNWLGAPIPTDGKPCMVRLRSSQKPVPARFFAVEGKERAEGLIRLETPIYGVAAGQAGVAYEGSRLLGGGWIVKTE